MPGQEVAVGDLVAVGGAGNPGLCAHVIPIVAGHLHAAEAGQTARDLQDHALGDPVLVEGAQCLEFRPTPHPLLPSQGRTPT